MNSQSRHWPTTRSARITLFLLAASIPLVVYGAIGALKSTSNDPRQWLPRTFAETDKYDRFQERFGTDEIAVVSWPGCTLTDPRVEQLAIALEGSPFFERAMTGPRMIRKLATSSKVPLKTALERMQGHLIGPDQRTTCVVLVTSATGRADRIAAVREITRQATAECNLAADALRLAGPTVDAAAIDAESRRLLFQLAGISALISFVVATLRLKSTRLAIMILAGAIYSTGLTLAVVYFSGGRMNLLMTMLPPLIYVLSVSASVHLANYYRDAVSDSPLSDATAVAIAQGWLPCVLAALTTAVGLVSLMTSKIDPIRMFGAYSAVGVMLSVVVLFLFLPSALKLFPPVINQQNRLPTNHNGGAHGVSELLMGGIGRHHAVVTIVCLILMVCCAWGLRHVKSTVRLQDRFLSGSEVLNDYRWLEEHVGPMVPLEVVIHFDHASPLDFLQRMQLVTKVQRQIQQLPQPVAAMSAADLAPPVPSGGGARQVTQRRVYEKRLADRRQRLIDARFLAEDEQEQLWRINVRAQALGDLDYGQFTETLRQQVEPLLREADARATYTGIIPLIYKAQRQLLQDLVTSFLAAFATIALVLMIVFRSWRATMLAMVPNLFPAVVVFGGMGWSQTAVQIGSVMTASAALGIAVDDTIHFLTWFRRGLDSGVSRLNALHIAFKKCAGAMAHTTMICSAGLLVFAVSSFVPILHFAWLMVFLLLAALVGDLILLPAILAGPLGSYFKARPTSTNHENPKTELWRVAIPHVRPEGRHSPNDTVPR